MLGTRIGPIELTTSQFEKTDGFGLHHIRWRSAGVAATFAEAQLDGGVGRHP